MNIKNDLIALINEAKSRPNEIGTWFLDLERINRNRWAIAIAWMEWDEHAGKSLYAKIAYQPNNSIMQCDYDIDWIMPYDKDTGEVKDTEIEICDIEADVDWLLAQWNLIKKEEENG